jgi:hypothetical protein
MFTAGSAALMIIIAASVPATTGAFATEPGVTQVAASLVEPKADPDRGMVYDGLLQVPDACPGGFQVRGTNLCTHGPDPAPKGVDINKRVSPLPASRSPQLAECNGDGVSGLRTQVIYARSSDVADQYAAMLASFRIWAEGADTIYNASAGETGGSRRIRFVHDAGCNITVANAVMSPTGDDNFSNTITELQAMGYNRTDRKYMIFGDAFVYCGIGTFNWAADNPGPDNINNGGPSYGRSDAGCWADWVLAHEHMHNLGGVQLSAPFTSGGAHCVDEWDVMCYSDAAGVVMQTLCPDPAHDSRFDCNHNDYYSTNPPVGTYLRDHWNAADSLYLTGGGRWGYVWANSPSAAIGVPYTPATAYNRSSSGAFNTVTRTAVGVYTVRFVGAGGAGGMVNVTAWGSLNTNCKVSFWGASGNDETATVRCFTGAGVATDAFFSASYAAPKQNPGDIGFVWANNATSAAYTPSLGFQFNSSGATNTIVRSGVGNYLVYLPWLGNAASGHVKVTAYGSDSNICKVGWWGQQGGLRIINVLCYTAAGVAADSLYTLTYVSSLAHLGVTGGAGGYVWNNFLSPAIGVPVTPSTVYQWNSTGGTNTVTRWGTGSYTVSFPGLNINNGNAQATAYGGGGNRCAVSTWGASATGMDVNVICSTPAGVAVDSLFNASFTR